MVELSLVIKVLLFVFFHVIMWLLANQVEYTKEIAEDINRCPIRLLRFIVGVIYLLITPVMMVGYGLYVWLSTTLYFLGEVWKGDNHNLEE